LDPNSPPQNWDELLRAVEAIDKLEGVSGIGMYGKAGGGETSFVFESLFTSAFGGPAWNSDTSRYVYDTPEGKRAAIEALTLIQKLVPFAQDNVVEFGRFDCRTLLRDGKVGIVLDGVNLANQVGKEMAAGTIKAALLPASPRGIVATAVNVGGWYIPTNSKYPDQTWRFLRYLMQTENQVQHAKYGSVPILRSEAAYYQGDTYKATVTASVGSSFAEGVSPKSNALWLSTGEQLQKLILGMQTPAETIENINKEHNSIYK
jgi:multiple sugar transport system substrate-binding protein